MEPFKALIQRLAAQQWFAVNQPVFENFENINLPVKSHIQGALIPIKHGTLMPSLMPIKHGALMPINFSMGLPGNEPYNVINEHKNLFEEFIEGFKYGVISELEQIQKENPSILINEYVKKAILNELINHYKDFFKEFVEGLKFGIIEELYESQRENPDAINKLLFDNVIDVQKDDYQIFKTIEDPIQNLIEVIDENNELLKKSNSDRENIIKESKEKILSRNNVIFNKPELSFGKRAFQYAISILGESFGLDEFTKRQIDKYNKREDFIQTESKLRPGVSRKQLIQDYKEIQKSINELQTLESRINVLRQSGYSEEQIKELGLFEKQTKEIENIISRDSRFIQERKILNEEQENETFLYQKKALDTQEEQNELLTQIRDILLNNSKENSETFQQQQESKNSIFDTFKNLSGVIGASKNVGGIIFRDGKIGKTTNTTKGSRISLGSLGKKIKPFALPALAVYAATNAIDYGLGKLGVGKSEIDEEQDEKNWQKMNFFQKIESGSARLIEKVGSFIGFDNIAKEARKERIERETRYFQNKEKENNLIIPSSNTSTSTIINATEKKLVSEKIKQTNNSELFAREIGKNIQITVPAPVVVPSNNSNQTQIIQQPFTSNIKNNEETITSYIRRLYTR